MSEEEELNKILKTAYRWDLYAVISPILFLILMGTSIYLGIVAESLVFHIGLFIFAITTILWWAWTIFTIKKLVITLNSVGKNLSWVKTEFKEIRKEIADLTKNNK